MVNAGEVYTTKEEKWAPERATVVVTLEEVPSWHHDEMIECLVVVDDSNVSMYGAGSTDRWHFRQLLEHFVRIA